MYLFNNLTQNTQYSPETTFMNRDCSDICLSPTFKSPNKPFKKYEDLFIQARYHERHYKQMSLALRRTEESIHQRAQELFSVAPLNQGRSVSFNIQQTTFNYSSSAATPIGMLPAPEVTEQNEDFKLTNDPFYEDLRSQLLSSFEDLNS